MKHTPSGQACGFHAGNRLSCASGPTEANEMTDTLAIARQLEEAGVDRKAAEATANAIQTSARTQSDNLVSKDYLRAELAALERRMYVVLVAAQVAVAGLLFAALQTF